MKNSSPPPWDAPLDPGAEILREPERGKFDTSRKARALEYIMAGAPWSGEFSRRIYAPLISESMPAGPDDELDPSYHGTGVGAIYCGCWRCAAVREIEELNGWVILPYTGNAPGLTDLRIGQTT